MCEMCIDSEQKCAYTFLVRFCYSIKKKKAKLMFLDVYMIPKEV